VTQEACGIRQMARDPIAHFFTSLPHCPFYTGCAGFVVFPWFPFPSVGLC